MYETGHLGEVSLLAWC